MMLEWLGFKAASTDIETAVKLAIADGETTRDLGGTLSTPEAGAAIRGRIGKQPG
jgi:isocitrate/isopropylmalate dehydrogenase